MKTKTKLTDLSVGQRVHIASANIEDFNIHLIGKNGVITQIVQAHLLKIKVLADGETDAYWFRVSNLAFL